MSFQVKYIYDLVDKMSPQLAKIQASVQKTTAAIEASVVSTSNSFSNVGNTLKQVGNNFRSAGMSLLPASAGIAAVGIGAIKSAANFETLQMQMEVLTGSAAKGQEVFQKLVKLGAETPFELKDLAKANNTLMGYGQTAEQAFHQIQLIGDISAVSGGDLQGITVAFGQAAASGRLMGQDLLQLVNNGVPIIDMLSKTLKVPKENIKEMVSQGAVTFPVLLKAFEDATGKGGKFENGMVKLSGTLGGLYSTLKDNVNIALSGFGQEIVKTLDLKNNMKAFNETIASMTEKFKALSPETKKFIIYAAGIIAVLAPILITIGLMLPALGMFATGLGYAALAFKVLTGAIAANPIGAIIVGLILVIQYWDEIVAIIKSVGAFIAQITFSDLIKAGKDILTVFADIFAMIGNILSKINVFKPIGDFLSKTFGSGEQLQNTALQEPAAINQQAQVNTSGTIGIQFANAPSGTSAKFTPEKGSSFDRGTNRVFAGAQ